MSAKQAQHEAAEALFGAIIALLDKHQHAHTTVHSPGCWRQLGQAATSYALKREISAQESPALVAEAATCVVAE
jgi:hypothetical protein